MRNIVAVAVALVAVAASAHAQINVRLQTEKDAFLQYEAIPVVLSIQNYSSRTIELTAIEGKPWLSFLVTDEGGNMVMATGETLPKDAVLVPSGQTVAYAVDLLPYYRLRHRGNFKVQAYVAMRGVTANTNPLRFTIMKGRELLSVTKGLPAEEGQEDQYRTYVLVARTMHGGDQLYALVRDDANERVFEMVLLGKYTPNVKPAIQVDREGVMHVLFQGAPRAFSYARISSEGRAIERKVFSDYQTAPELLLANGEVTVIGGEQVFPKPERILTEEDLNPSPPPPIIKKKPWWKFWGSASTNSVSSKAKSPAESK